MACVLVSLLAMLALAASVHCESGGSPKILPAGMRFSSREYASFLTVPNGEQFGLWMWPEMCPENYFAVGFSLKVEANQYGADDTALNGIRLFCAQDESRSFMYTVESHTGHFGDWTDPHWCPSGTLTSFQLRVEPYLGLFGDDTSVNNIRFRCSTYPTLEGKGTDWGEYGHWSMECSNGGICGIETKMEVYQGGLDDTSLNDVRFHCCTKSQK